MIVENNVDLSKKTTFHVGGTARQFYIPQSESDLVELVKRLTSNNDSFRVISGGSNILINDKKVFDHVIYMGEAVTEIEHNGEGRFYVGASVRIQKVIHFVNKAGYGGFEELIGLPALFGGIVYMNAGIGGRNSGRFNISDFIEDVKVLEIRSGEIKWMKKTECKFGYRSSVFQSDKYIILGANLILKERTEESSSRRIKKRQKYIKSNQDWGKGCFGTCFSRCDVKILKRISLLRIFWRGVYQSPYSYNWIVNDGTGTYASAMRFINLCRLLHKITSKEIECEVRIWD